MGRRLGHHGLRSSSSLTRSWARAGWRTTRVHLLLDLIVVADSNHFDWWRRLDVRCRVGRKTFLDGDLHLLHSSLTTSRILLEGQLLCLATLVGDGDGVVEIKPDVGDVLQDESKELCLAADLQDNITSVLWRRSLLAVKHNKVILQATHGDASKVVADINAVAASVNERLGLALLLVRMRDDLDEIDGLIGQHQGTTLTARHGSDKKVDVVVLGDGMAEHDLLVVCTLLLQHGLESKVITVVDVITAEVLCIAADGETTTLLLANNTIVHSLVKVVVVVLQSELQEETLNSVGVDLNSTFTHFLEGEHSLGLTDEKLCLTLCIWILARLGRRLLEDGLDDQFSTFLKAATPFGPSLRAAHTETIEELIISLTEGITSTTDASVLQKTQILHLVHNTAAIKVHGTLSIVGLDATDVVHLALGKLVHQLLDGLLDLETSSSGTLLITLTNRDASFGEERDKNTVVGGTAEITVIVVESITVLIAHTISRVLHITGVVLDDEGTFAQLRDKVCVLTVSVGSLGKELLIRTHRHSAHIIKDTEETSRTGMTLNKITANLIVKVIDILPRDALGLVFFLLSLQGELDENLLKLLVHVVDAKLLKTVLAKDLETVDIENVEADMALALCPTHSLVDALDGPVEQAAVHGLCECITSNHGRIHRVDSSISADTSTAASGTSGDGVVSKHLSEGASIDTEEVGSKVDSVHISDGGLILGVGLEGHVTDGKDSSDDTPYLQLLLL